MSVIWESIPKNQPMERFKYLCDKGAVGHKHLRGQEISENVPEYLHQEACSN